MHQLLLLAFSLTLLVSIADARQDDRLVLLRQLLQTEESSSNAMFEIDLVDETCAAFTVNFINELLIQWDQAMGCERCASILNLNCSPFPSVNISIVSSDEVEDAQFQAVINTAVIRSECILNEADWQSAEVRVLTVSETLFIPNTSTPGLSLIDGCVLPPSAPSQVPEAPVATLNFSFYDPNEPSRDPNLSASTPAEPDSVEAASLVQEPVSETQDVQTTGPVPPVIEAEPFVEPDFQDLIDSISSKIQSTEEIESILAQGLSAFGPVPEEGDVDAIDEVVSFEPIFESQQNDDLEDSAISEIIFTAPSQEEDILVSLPPIHKLSSPSVEVDELAFLTTPELEIILSQPSVEEEVDIQEEPIEEEVVLVPQQELDLDEDILVDQQPISPSMEDTDMQIQPDVELINFVPQVETDLDEQAIIPSVEEPDRDLIEQGDTIPVQEIVPSIDTEPQAPIEERDIDLDESPLVVPEFISPVPEAIQPLPQVEQEQDLEGDAFDEPLQEAVILEDQLEESPVTEFLSPVDEQLDDDVSLSIPLTETVAFALQEEVGVFEVIFPLTPQTEPLSEDLGVTANFLPPEDAIFQASLVESAPTPLPSPPPPPLQIQTSNIIVEEQLSQGGEGVPPVVPTADQLTTLFQILL